MKNIKNENTIFLNLNVYCLSFAISRIYVFYLLFFKHFSQNFTHFTITTNFCNKLVCLILADLYGNNCVLILFFYSNNCHNLIYFFTIDLRITIYLFFLNFCFSGDTTESELCRVFSAYGNVKSTKIIVDRAGVSKGYGFVTFETELEAQRLQNDVSFLFSINYKISNSFNYISFKKKKI